MADIVLAIACWSLAGGVIAAINVHAYPQHRRDLIQAVGWLTLIFAGAVGLFLMDAFQLAPLPR